MSLSKLLAIFHNDNYGRSRRLIRLKKDALFILSIFIVFL